MCEWLEKNEGKNGGTKKCTEGMSHEEMILMSKWKSQM